MEQANINIESFIEFLISKHILDSSEESDTLTKYLQLFDQFNDQIDHEDS